MNPLNVVRATVAVRHLSPYHSQALFLSNYPSVCHCCTCVTLSLLIVLQALLSQKTPAELGAAKGKAVLEYRHTDSQPIIAYRPTPDVVRVRPLAVYAPSAFLLRR